MSLCGALEVRVMISAPWTLPSGREGGRSTPLPPSAYSGAFRPHIVIGDQNPRAAIMRGRDGFPTGLGEEYPGVASCDGPNRNPLRTGIPMEIVLSLCYRPSSMYDAVTPGATFTLREGGRVVGFAEVTRRLEERDAEPAAEGDAPSRAP